MKIFLKIKSIIISKRILVNYLMVLFLAFFVPLIIITIWFFSSIYTNIANSAEYNNRQSAQKTCEILKGMIDEMDVISYKLENMAAFYPAAFKRDPLTTVNMMQMYKNVNRNIKAINIIYKDYDKILTTLGTTEIDILFMNLPLGGDMLSDIQRSTKPVFFNTLYYGDTLSNYFLVYAVPLPSLTAHPSHFVLFTIDHKTMSELASISRGDDITSSDIILNADGMALWSSIAAQVEELAEFRWLDNNFPEDNFGTVRLDISHGLQFIRKIDKSPQLDRLNEARLYFILCCLIIVTTGILLIRTGIQKSYAPIGRLASTISREFIGDTSSENEIEKISKAYHYAKTMNQDLRNNLNASISELRSLFVVKMIQGHISDKEMLQNICKNLSIVIKEGLYIACCALIHSDDSPGGDENVKWADVNDNLSGEFDGSFFYYNALDSLIIGIIWTSSNEAEAQMIIMKKVHEVLRNYYSMTTLSFGKPCQDILQIGKSYIEAKTVLNYRFIKGINTILSPYEVSLISENPDWSDYPAKLINTYSVSMQTFDQEMINENLEEILEYIMLNPLTLYQVKCICFDMVSNFIKYTQLNHVLQPSFLKSFDIFSIAEFDSVEQLIQSLKSMSAGISRFLDENTKITEKNNVNNYIEYLIANISNYQFSLDEMADEFKVSVQYLRKCFKNEMGKSIIVYFNDMKIEEAKKQLAETDESITTITKSVGYIDSSSFIRKFRLEVGMTPGKYRLMHRTKL